jgi:hypothetical protein
VKELSFTDEILEQHPNLIKNGIVCPSEPFWFEYIETKYTELASDFPGLRGVIVSPGSPEGRASLAQRKCSCPVCEKTVLSDWYSSIILSMHRPLAEAGMCLAVREFSYRPVHQDALIEAVDSSPSDVVFCIKVTPHDFYPTFPHNPALGVLKRTQWIEYDVLGQFYGWGIFPCFMHDDLLERIEYAQRSGVSGALLRTEWERINDWWCLESPNRVNLITGSHLTAGSREQPDSLCRQWMEETGLSPSSGAVDLITELFLETWPVIKKGIYMDDFVFHDCSQFPLSIGRAWWTMENKHGLADWQPDRRGELHLDQRRIESLIEEKEQALSQIRRLSERVKKDHKALGAEFGRLLINLFGLFEDYIYGFRLIAEVNLYARWWQQEEDIPEAELWRIRFETSLKRLEDFTVKLDKLSSEPRHRHQLLMLLSAERARNNLRDGWHTLDR